MKLDMLKMPGEDWDCAAVWDGSVLEGLTEIRVPILLILIMT